VSLGSGPTILAKLERGGAPGSWTLLSGTLPEIVMADATIKRAAAIEICLRRADRNRAPNA
jgi:hypothetical protein